MNKCKLCNNETNIIFNIKFKAMPICQSCADSISLQNIQDLLTNNSIRVENRVIKKNGGQLALITKRRTPDIIIMSNNEKDFEQAIETMYWNKIGMKSKSEEWTKEDMLKEYKKVKIYLEEIG